MRILLAVSLVLFSVLAAPGWGSPIRVVTTEELRPFEALVAGVAGSAGYQLSFSYEPQARMMTDLKNGQAQAAFFLSDSAVDGVPGLVKIPISLYRNELVAVTVDPGIVINGINDLKHFSVGIERGNLNHRSVLNDVVDVTEASDQDLQFRMLKGARFQVAISAKALVPSLAKRAGIDRYYIQRPPLKVSPTYFAVMDTGDKVRIGALTKAFRKVVEDGTWFKEVNRIIASLEP